MSEIKYGLISKLDSEILMKTVDLICDEFSDDTINFTEIGIYAGATGNALSQYIKSKNRKCLWTGIDSKKDGEVIRFHPTVFIPGDSSRVYNSVKDESQHLIVQDANHSYPNAIQDFFCYMRKVMVGGYMWWHDTAPHVQGTGWQKIGDQKDSDMSIAVRKALTDIGLFDNKHEGWEFVMEDADLNDAGGGCSVFRRIK